MSGAAASALNFSSSLFPFFSYINIGLMLVTGSPELFEHHKSPYFKSRESRCIV